MFRGKLFARLSRAGAAETWSGAGRQMPFAARAASYVARTTISKPAHRIGKTSLGLLRSRIIQGTAKQGLNPASLIGIAGVGAAMGVMTGSTRAYYGAYDWSPLMTPGRIQGVTRPRTRQRGMAHDHLGTDGLVLALHRVRHR